MKKLLSTMLITVMLCTMMSMTVFASYVPSKEDEYFLPETTEEVPGDEYYQDESKAPKTGDDRIMIYTAVMAAIAVTGTVVIAKRKED